MNDDGSISGTDADNTQKITIPAPFMYDSDNKYSDSVSYTLEQESINDEYILTISADNEWIDSEETVFPVVIDPVVQTSQAPQNIQSTFVASKAPTTSYGGNGAMLVGNNYDYNNCRTLIKFTLPALKKSDVVVDAQVNLYQYTYSFDPASLTQKTFHAHMATSSWTESATWNTKPSYNGTILEYGFIDKNNGWKSLDITKAVKQYNRI